MVAHHHHRKSSENNFDVDDPDPQRTADALQLVSYLKSKGAILVSGITGSIICEHAAQGDLMMLKKYWLSGEDLSIGNYDCRTGLHLACCEGHGDVALWLVRVGNCDPRAKDRWENTAISEARRYGYEDLAVKLEGEVKEGRMFGLTG